MANDNSTKISKGKLNNAFTHFGAFTWGEDERLRKKLEDLREKLKLK